MTEINDGQANSPAGGPLSAWTNHTREHTHTHTQWLKLEGGGDSPYGCTGTSAERRCNLGKIRQKLKEKGVKFQKPSRLNSEDIKEKTKCVCVSEHLAPGTTHGWLVLAFFLYFQVNSKAKRWAKWKTTLMFYHSILLQNWRQIELVAGADEAVT